MMRKKQNKWDKIFRFAVAAATLLVYAAIAIILVAIDVLSLPMTIICSVVAVLIVYGIITY